MNILKQSVSRHVETRFKRAYDWKVVFRPVSGVSMPEFPDLDVFIREHSYGPTEIEMDEIDIGSIVRNFPRKAMPVTSTVTIRDDQHETVGAWLDSIAARMVNRDGTQNLPYDPEKGWVLIMDRYRIIYDREDEMTFELASSMEVVFRQRGDVDESYSELGFLAYPAVFVQFRS